MRAILLRYGHAPSDIDGYSLRDCRLFMRALPTIHGLEWGVLGSGDS